MNRCSISGNNTEQVLQSQITNLQSNIVVTGTNLGVGPNVFTQLTTGTDTVAIGSGASSGNYSLTTGSGNVMLGANSGGGCVTGSNNTLLGYNTSMLASYILGSIALGAGTKTTGYNQLMVAPNVTAFNIAGLAALTGTGTGTILEFDLAGNVLPTAGTYKTVASIDTAIAAVNAPYAMSWAANTIYPYDGGTTVQALAIWDTLSFGNSANMASKTTWKCPAAGLWHIAATFGFNMNTNDKPCLFQLYHNGSEVWYFTAWYNISTAGEGITTQCESIFLNLATGNTLEWYLLLGGNITMTIGGGVNNSGNTTFNAIRIAPGYTAA
jgi:hypothetical protein